MPSVTGGKWVMSGMRGGGVGCGVGSCGFLFPLEGVQGGLLGELEVVLGCCCDPLGPGRHGEEEGEGLVGDWQLFKGE